MNEPIYSAVRSRKFLLRMLFLITVNSTIWLFTFSRVYSQDGARGFHYGILIAVGVLIVTQLMILIFSRRPLTLYEDKVRIGSIFPFVIMRNTIVGTGLHKKRGDVCLVIENDRGDGQLILPWRTIAEPVDEVVAALKSYCHEDASDGTEQL